MARSRRLTPPAAWTALPAFALAGASSYLLYHVALHPKDPAWDLPASSAAVLGWIGLFVLLSAWGLADAALHPHATWWRAGRSKALWVLAQVAVPVAGPLLYFAVIHPRLGTAGRRSEQAP